MRESNLGFRFENLQLLEAELATQIVKKIFGYLTFII